VSVSEFLFAVRLTGREPFDKVLGDVATNVFRHVGCTASEVTQLVEQLNAVVTANLDGEPDVRVQFRGSPGSCEVIVLAANREVWRTTHLLP
jgi:hypothetical protein